MEQENCLKTRSITLVFTFECIRILIFIVNIFWGETSDPMSGFLFLKKDFHNNKSKLFNKGYKILMDLIYIDNKKRLIFDVGINFDTRKKE